MKTAETIKTETQKEKCKIQLNINLDETKVFPNCLPKHSLLQKRSNSLFEESFKLNHEGVIREQKNEFQRNIAFSWLFKNNKRQLPIFKFNFTSKNKLFNKLSLEINTHIKRVGKSLPRTNNEHHLKKLEATILKFMMSQKIKNSEVSTLSKNEQTILYTLLRKKKIQGLSLGSNNPLFPSEIVQKNFTKRVEENLKLVLNKAFSFLQENFRKSFPKALTELVPNRYAHYLKTPQFAFFAFYFEETALRLDQEIERFFLPRVLNKKKQKNNTIRAHLIPKTISRVYLNNIRMSPWFIQHLRVFLDQVFLQEQVPKIQAKVTELVSKWAGLVDDLGWDQGLKIITKKIHGSETSKLAWTYSDLKRAVDQTLSNLLKD